MTAYTSKPKTVNIANAAIRSGFSSHTGVMAAGFLIQAKAGFYRGVLLVIRLQNLRVRTHLRSEGRREDGPAVVGLHIGQRFDLRHKTIAGFYGGKVGFGWPSSACPS